MKLRPKWVKLNVYLQCRVPGYPFAGELFVLLDGIVLFQIIKPGNVESI